MKFFTQLKKSEVKGKTILLRVDFDVHDDDIKYSLRVKRAIETIRFIRTRGSRVVILTHRGRPASERIISNFKFLISNEENKKFSLKPFVKIIEKELKEGVVFIPDIVNGKNIITQSDKNIFLCENLRFYKGEQKNNKIFAKKLAQLGDIYVNDAFANSHRAHASMCAITASIPSYVGPALEAELVALNRVLKTPQRPFVALVGGVKVSDKIGLLNWFVSHADTILTGGGVANTFLLWCGYNIGSSVHDAVSTVKKFVLQSKIQVPRDTEIKNNSIFDIGPRTARWYGQEISRAYTIVWNGPLGLTDVPQFQKGSRAIWRAIEKRAKSNSRVAVIIGGGETVSFICKESKQIPQNVFLSTGGGALLTYMSGKKMPALETLR
ncbi:MAG: phosphoglycerate kinase [Candidatus Paceibacterota bacterium]